MVILAVVAPLVFGVLLIHASIRDLDLVVGVLGFAGVAVAALLALRREKITFDRTRRRISGFARALPTRKDSAIPRTDAAIDFDEMDTVVVSERSGRATLRLRLRPPMGALELDDDWPVDDAITTARQLASAIECEALLVSGESKEGLALEPLGVEGAPQAPSPAPRVGSADN